MSSIYQSMVVIETYSETFRGDPIGIKTFILVGLNVPRTFYSPRYDGIERKDHANDNRATLFWDPSLTTDSTGEATREFYTGDRKTSMEIIVNGIDTIRGYTGQGHTILDKQ